MKKISIFLMMLMAFCVPLAMNGQTTQLVQVTSLEVGSTYVITVGNYAVGNTVYTTSNNHMITSVSFNASDTPSTSIQYTIESGNATNGYIFKNVENGKYIGYTSDEYLTVVTSGGMAMRYDGTDLINSTDSDGYYYMALASSDYNYAYFTTSKGTGQNIVIYKVVTGSQGGGDTYVWVETTTITPNEEYLIGFSNGSDVYLAVNYAVNQTNHYYESSNSSYYGYTAKASFDGNGYVTGVSGHATDLQYCTWKFSSASGGTITSGYESNKYLRTWTSTSYADCYVDGTSQTWTYSSGTLYRTISSTNRYAQYTTINSTPHMCVANSVPTGYSVKLYTKQLVETGYAVNASTTITNGSIQFSINGGYDWYDNLSNVSAGETVVISVEPETGYQLTGAPTVTPTSGTAPTVSGSGNLYSFVMPESDVTVNATFNCTAPANPTFSVATGTYTSVQNVSISCATASATIYYTTDGSTPTSSSTQYNGAITINTTTTLKAIAYIGSCTSGVTTATYTMNLPTYTVTCATGLTGGSITASPASAIEGTIITITATTESGYFVGTITATDASNNDVAVTVNGNEGTFTMPASNVTVTATFTQGFNVTLVQTAHGTISADQTTNLLPGDHVTLTATPDNGCVFLAWYAYETGNPRDVVAVISNTTILMPASDVTVQAVFVTEEQHEQTVGGGSNTDGNLPTNVYMKYSLTQQIYTAAEIGYNGRITSIAFKANGTATRSLEVYMAHTDLTAFSSTTGWEVMGSVSKVFTGSVSFTSGDWTTITLDTPFEYDGTSNLNICVADRTGSWVTNITFNTYSTSANRALYINDDNTDYGSGVGYSNTLSGYTGTYSTSNNQIKLVIKVPGSAESLTISPDVINDFSYVEGQGPSQIHKLDIVGVDLENNITLTAPTNFEISLTENGTYTSSLTIPRETGSKGNRTVTSWDFEDGLQGWTVVDADGDGYNWTHNTSFGGHNGSTGILYSQSYDNNAGTLDPDNWLISPQVELGGSFSMWAHPQQPAYPAEHFGIYVSTTNTNISSFTLLDEWTLNSGDWKQFSVDLRLYTGQTGYIAVRHFNGMDQFYINVDDFMLDTDAAISIEIPVTITPATVFVRMKDNLNAGNYSGNLTAYAGSGNNVNGSVSLSGEVIAAYNITVTANPAEGGSVAGAGRYVTGTSVTVSARTNAPYSFINWTENGTVVSTDATYTFTVNGRDRNLVANFGFVKHINAYEGDGGYYLIASPLANNVAPTNVAGMITDEYGAEVTLEASTYDLYSFDQAQELEWRNYRASNFSLVNGQGYLYASKEGTDLVFTGAANSNNTQDVTLSLTTAAPGLDFPDWNLVGNPFAKKAYITKSFYTLENSDTYTLNTAGTEILAMQGLLVIADYNNEPLNFTTVAPNSKVAKLNMNVSKDRSVVDQAIISFNEGQQLPKLQFRNGSTKVYMPMDGKEYAIVSAEAMGTMPVNFKAENNGTYTLSFTAEDVNFAYLHLIDNMTGEDVDLLAGASTGSATYTFDAKTTDFESRFKLVFATGDSNDDTFAFYSNGSFVINNEGNATLQVIDVNGRILKSESINGCANVNVNAAQGIYMLRLVNGNDVKVQKVVVR